MVDCLVYKFLVPNQSLALVFALHPEELLSVQVHEHVESNYVLRTRLQS